MFLQCLVVPFPLVDFWDCLIRFLSCLIFPFICRLLTFFLLLKLFCASWNRFCRSQKSAKRFHPYPPNSQEKNPLFWEGWLDFLILSRSLFPVIRFPQQISWHLLCTGWEPQIQTFPLIGRLQYQQTVLRLPLFLPFFRFHFAIAIPPLGIFWQIFSFSFA